MLAIATLLTTVITTPSEVRVEAIVNSQRCWIAFRGQYRAKAQATILAAHASKLARIHALGLETDADTRVLLMVRIDLDSTGPIRNSTSWASPPVLAWPETAVVNMAA